MQVEWYGQSAFPLTLFAFTLGGRRVAHLGDLGQRALRDEQAQALGSVDLLFVPVGGGPTIGAEQAAEIAARLSARVVVPMHYRTERIDFLEPVDAFAQRAERVERLSSPSFELEALPAVDGPLVVVPAAP
jgi:L-ascorbate metabolism protein UlaG (beta-lactamase superfamily)